MWEPDANWVSGLDIVDGLRRLLGEVQSAINLNFAPLCNVPPVYLP